MTLSFQRFTTQYSETEDRILLTGETGDGAPLVMALTQRMLLRLVPAVLAWLEGQAAGDAHRDILHGFAQQAATAELPPLPPVQARAESASWLVQTVDVQRGEDGMVLTFRAGPEQAGTRQWLGIVYEGYLKSGWMPDVWPNWLKESRRIATPDTQRLH
jgi:hypothetical protein